MVPAASRVCVCLIQVRQQVEEQMALKSSELEQYLQRVKELEVMYHQLEEALEDERQAKLDEEAMRKLQARCTNPLLSVFSSMFLVSKVEHTCYLQGVQVEIVFLPLSQAAG